ncbi:hypothetical protein HN51_028455 [Arachis hypogaea]
MSSSWQQGKLREFCKQKGIHLAAWSPLGSYTKSWDVDMKPLSGLQNLALLNLEGCFVTAACLDTLAELPALSNLNISRCNFTNNGCEMFSLDIILLLASCFINFAEFACLLCRKVLSVPVTTPCGHNFCKSCFESASSGKSFIRKRGSEGGRTLRAQKNVMKCPSCSMDIAEFLQNPEVVHHVSF